MKPWVLLDRAPVPGGGGDLRLLQRGDEFSINLDGGVLMGSRMRGSETALAHLACDSLRTVRNSRILIGGLGMGFTLRAALDMLDASAAVVVAELVPAVVDWVRGPLAVLSANGLDDPRVMVRLGDVADAIGEASALYDAILLDVDNGPDGLTRAGNDGLYSATGLQAARSALRPGGVLAIWSAGGDAAFTQRLVWAGFSVAEVRVPAHGKKGLRHLIWVATRPKDKAKAKKPGAGPGLSRPRDRGPS